MTLQYRIRNDFEDQLWRHQISLCEAVLSKMLDEWCVSGSFPTSDAIAAILYLLSSRNYVYGLSTSDVYQFLKSIVGSAETEYQKTWPDRSSDEAAAIVGSLSAIISLAIEIWETRGVAALSIPTLMDALVAEILAHRYVIMHHFETTRRDPNRFGI